MLEIPEFALISKKQYNRIRAERMKLGLAIKSWFTPEQVGTERGGGSMGFTW